VRVLVFTCFLFLVSCSENSRVDILKGSIRVTPEPMGVTAIDNIVWKVGPLKKQEVSKGIRVEFKMPYLKSSEIEEIVNRYNVDSWLIRLRRRGLMKNQILGRAFLPLFARQYPRGNNLRIRQSRKVTFRVGYHASAVSTRFANFTCPAFDHNFLVNNTELKAKSERMGNILISGVEKVRVLAKVEKFDYSLTIDGGANLQGEYIVELAFYNSEQKNRLSNWLVLSDIGIVGREKEVALRGCEGFQIPEKKPDEDKLKQFKFGR